VVFHKSCEYHVALQFLFLVVFFCYTMGLEVGLIKHYHRLQFANSKGAVLASCRGGIVGSPAAMQVRVEKGIHDFVLFSGLSSSGWSRRPLYILTGTVQHSTSTVRT
jgi:hypothetical protein